jgi:hypothetical protein
VSTMNHYSNFRLDLEPYRVFGDASRLGRAKLIPEMASLPDMTEWRSLMAKHVKHSESSPCAQKEDFDAEQDRFLKQLVLPDCSPISELDILVGRNKHAVNHQGNKRFRCIVSSFLPQYFEKDCRTTRSRLVLDIIAAIELSGGRFLKQSPCGCGHWVVLGQTEKRNKVGHALRDAASAARAHCKPKPEITTNPSIVRNAKQLPPPPLSVAEAGKESGSSPFEDHTIGVDFPVDLDLLMLMP